MAIAAWRKGVAEFVGAFTLIFIGAGAIISTGGTDLLLIALAHGLAIGVMASAFAHISGGHFNPAVTLGALVGRQISLRLALLYWASQLLGATVAAVALLGVVPAGHRRAVLRQLVRLLDRAVHRRDRRGPVVRQRVPREASISALRSRRVTLTRALSHYVRNV